MRDGIGSTIGDGGQGNAVGKDINMFSVGNNSTNSDKIDEVYRLLYQTSERVARLETLVLVLAVVVSIAVIIFGVRLM